MTQRPRFFIGRGVEIVNIDRRLNRNTAVTLRQLDKHDFDGSTFRFGPQNSTREPSFVEPSSDRS
jgi:hypothetical protein